jgi:hypothetical protein
LFKKPQSSSVYIVIGPVIFNILKSVTATLIALFSKTHTKSGQRKSNFENFSKRKWKISHQLNFTVRLARAKRSFSILEKSGSRDAYSNNAQACTNRESFAILVLRLKKYLETSRPVPDGLLVH